MKFTIITPSFNQLEYLKRCVASVADQVGSQSEQRTDDRGQTADQLISDLRSPTSESEAPLCVHHHVQDACSSDETVDWLRQYGAEVRGQRADVIAPKGSNLSSSRNQLASDGDVASTKSNYQLTFASEADNGMYDALNRGVKLAIEGDRHQAPSTSDQKTTNFSPQTSNRNDSIIAWLNCDEQYLPGTLEKVAAFFAANPDVDILTGDYLVVDVQGELMAYRKGYRLRKNYVEASHLYTLSCATFYRQRVFEQVGEFDTSFKAAADEEFILRALGSGFKAHHLKAYLSVFTYSGDNLGAGAVADREHLELKRRAPQWVRILKPAINAVRLCEKWLSGSYFQKFPLTYSIYAGDAAARKEFVCQRTGWKWPTGGE